MDHPSDLTVRAFGSSLEDTFTQAAMAMWELTGVGPIGEDVQDSGSEEPAANVISKRISLENDDLEGLLVDFLNEQIFLLDSERFVLKRITYLIVGRRNGRFTLEAELRGVLANPLPSTVWHQIKAATYHGLKVTPFEAEVTFDV